MEEITKESTVAEVVSNRLGSDHIFSKYKIDFCCGGNATLEVACKDNGVEFETLKQEIDLINNRIVGDSGLNDLDIASLIIISKSDYHAIISNQLTEILPYASKVSEVHGIEHKEVIEINKLVKRLLALLNTSFNTSINLYAIIKDILLLENLHSRISSKHVINMQSSLEKNEITHQLIAETLKNISALSSNYIAPKGACNTYQYLYKNLKVIEHKVHKYMHLEKSIIIPKALKIIEK